ncbi:MAG TPA: L,D-transpeptidase [Jatrophihabitans sp.]|nr:L,D-transpeptidase [Jatrophihabitans sp.]
MRKRIFALLAGLSAIVVLTAACTGSPGPQQTVTKFETPSGSSSSTQPPESASASSSASSKPAPPKHKRTVHVYSLNSDGAVYGIGMPIVLFFSPRPTNSTAFTKAVKVTVNGHPVNGAWFWEQPTADEVHSHTIEAHYRTQQYWPAHSHVHVKIPIGGLSAGKNLVYDNRLTSLDFHIGAAHISTVNAATHRMRVTSDGHFVKSIKVSLGAAATPTYSGTKVVMQKGEDTPGTNKLRPQGAVRMQGPGYDEIVDWSVRITRSGEYIHAAPWNGLIGQTSTSNGCTNLFTDAAKWYYSFARVGDVAIYPHTDGKPMPSWDGFGDWNVSWPQWQQGGLLLNH